MFSFAADNHVADATITAWSESPTAPASNLADHRLWRRWVTHGSVTTTVLTLDYGGEERTASCVSLFDADVEPDFYRLRFFPDAAAAQPHVFSQDFFLPGADVVMPLRDGGTWRAIPHKALKIEMHASPSRQRSAGHLHVSSVLDVPARVRSWRMDGDLWRVTLGAVSRQHMRTLGSWTAALPLVVLPQPGEADDLAGLFVLEQAPSERETRPIEESWSVDLSLRRWTPSDS